MFEILLIHIMLQFVPTNQPILNSTYDNINSFTQIYQLTNAATGGLEELFLMLLMFFIFTGGGIIAGQFSPVNSALGAAMIMVVLSVFAQSVFMQSGGGLGALMPLIFVAIALLCAMISMLGGFLNPYS